MKPLMWSLAVCIAICTSGQAIVTSDGLGTHVASQMTDTFGVNLDGVALIGADLPAGPDGFCSGALITDSHVLATARCFDLDFDFQIDESLFLGPSEVLLEIDGSWIALNYDPAKIVWPQDWMSFGTGPAVVLLEADAPSSVPRYALYGGNQEIGQPFVLAGYGLTGFGATGIDPAFDQVRTKRAGLNSFDALEGVARQGSSPTRGDAQLLRSDFDSGRAEHNSLVDLGFGADEVTAAPYDSGGPGFLDGAIAGVVTYLDWLPDVDATGKPDASWGEYFYSNRISTYRDFILNATDGEAVFVTPDATAILGDFDDDQLLTDNDIDMLSRAIRFGIDHISFDLNGDQAVNQLDREKWVHDLAGTFFGDSNMDGTVGFADFLSLSGSFSKAGDWANGDSDGNGVVQFDDFLILSENFGQSSNELATVPEPSISSVLVAVILVFGRWVLSDKSK